MAPTGGVEDRYLAGFAPIEGLSWAPSVEPERPTQTRSRRSLGERVAELIVPQRNPAGAVYGLVTVGALLAAESGLHDTYPETIGSAALAMLLYWFAHSYSDVLGLRLAERESFSWATLWATFSHDWPIAQGAGIPLLVLLLAWATGAEQQTAVTDAVWSTVASLIVFELAAGVRSRARPLELVLEALVGAGMGSAILLLRALLH
ncbi:MAG TPA: hypothetical protein VNU24_05085 [Solirubrobacteraceae bacterium]|nr:hypothetical protein [Solirubrobacteraceae bacterium]